MLRDDDQAIKEVTVFSWWDPRSINTWSNVTYYLIRTLETKGIKVNTVTLSKHHRALLGAGAKVTNVMLSKLYQADIHFSYANSQLSNKMIDLKISHAVKKYHASDVFIMIGFDYNVKKHTDQKVLMFSDWTVAYAIDKFDKRRPIFAEKGVIKRHNQALKEADFAVTLFSDVKDFYLKKEDQINLHYLGNVINSSIVSKPESEAMIHQKIKSNHILFIGRERYKAGLYALMDAIKTMSKSRALTLDVIGMNQISQHLNIPINFHGYLDKSDDEQKSLYYSLLKNAKIIINTTPDWAGFSSMLECMYHATPVIVTKYQSFVGTFGESLNFGYYCDNKPERIAQKIDQIFSLGDEAYGKMALSAYEATLDFTWDSYVDKMLALITK